MRYRTLISFSLLALSSSALALSVSSYDDGYVFVDVSADDTLTCDASATAYVDLIGISDVGVDVVFILDASGSLQEDGWATSKEATAGAVELLRSDIERGDVRVGLVTFASGATEEWNFADTQDADAIIDHLADMPFPGGYTYTRDGLDAAISIVASDWDGSRAARFVLLPDGVPNPNTAQNPCLTSGGTSRQRRRAQQTRDDLATYEVVIGVGTSWDPSILECLVEDPDSDIQQVEDVTEDDLLDALPPPPAGTDGTVVVDLGADFDLDAISVSEGTASASGSSITWTVDTLDEEGATLTIDYTHSSGAGGDLDLVASGSLSYTDTDGNPVSGALDAVSITTESCDSDGDGIDDSEDVCPDSVFDVSSEIDADGCTVDDYCPCDDAWSNHGEYVSCVASVSNDFKSEGILSGKDKGAIQSDAAGSTCGS